METKLSKNKVKFALAIAMIIDLFRFSAMYGTLIYFGNIFIGNEKSFTYCFLFCLFARCILMLFVFVVAQKDVDKLIDNRIEKSNKEQ